MNGCKGNKIRHIVRLRQIVRKWRKIASARKAALGFACVKISPRSSGNIPADVPAGYMAVYVGEQCTRFVIKATLLNHPMFGPLLDKAEEEYGFNPQGGLTIPCDELLFEHIVCLVGRNDPAARHLSLDELQTNFWHYCSSEALAERVNNFGKVSIPLLRPFAERSVR